ncbi:lipoyl protein ligase domain-containing protein [Sulfuriroseicoccus oceanibius]|uniref:Lipoate--protein ligase family protein n=1 Tax=Sulfuriroseicoccus oceanibius TaxID=2707525 RepID=A0A6B3LEC3_9BACT|nr:lipoate--protein ligase family protein [Sulfuriroseicoccus oceanibius]QQL44649.1 lipoate--protein ligase family protein [Sulfuriroseicoccus oceanibius]
MFERLDLWFDRGDRDAAGQMAVDEVLLQMQRDVPLLRVYQWSGPAITLGYFESVAEARQKLDAYDVPVVRRFTGGGSVLHGDDFPYTLIVPKGEATDGFLRARTESYEVIHSALGAALAVVGVAGVGLAASGGQQVGVPCFQSPVEADLVQESGDKVAGAGQRRTRDGLIHQGSVVVGAGVDRDALGRALAAALARDVRVLGDDWLPDGFGESWAELRTQRYDCDNWNLRR